MMALPLPHDLTPERQIAFTREAFVAAIPDHGARRFDAAERAFSRVPDAASGFSPEVHIGTIKAGFRIVFATAMIGGEQYDWAEVI